MTSTSSLRFFCNMSVNKYNWTSQGYKRGLF